jgi:hypothetical protein
VLPEARPARLRRMTRAHGELVQAYGFPEGWDYGTIAKAAIAGQIGPVWVQVDGVSAQGPPIEHGFSGAPAWDLTLNGVVGMVVSAHPDLQLKVACVIPTETIAKAWRKLEPLLRDAQRERIGEGIANARRRSASPPVKREGRERVVGYRTGDIGEGFRDRAHDQERLGELLSDPLTRVVTIHGREGMGKTALAAHVVGNLEKNRWPHTDRRKRVDGIVYRKAGADTITLEQLFHDACKLLGPDRGLPLRRIWASPGHDVQAKARLLVQALAGGLYVVVVDNTETLLDGGGRFADEGLRVFFEALLTEPTGLKLVLTSRRTLAFPAAALHLDKRIALDCGLPTADAIQVLRDLDSGDFGLAHTSPERLERAATRVRGIPYKLRKVAQILDEHHEMTLEDVVETFSQHEFDQLVAASYDALTLDERDVVQVLAVLGRPVGALAVDAVLEPFVAGLDAKVVLDRLVRSKVVLFDREHSEGRYHLHPLDEMYALSQLATDGPYRQRALHCAAADYYASIRQPPAHHPTLEDLEPLLLEFDHRLAAGQHDAAAEILAELDAPSLPNRGHATLVRRMCTELAGKVRDRKVEATRLFAIGTAKAVMGEPDGALSEFRRAQAIASGAGDERTATACLAWQGIIARYQGRPARARPLLEQALASGVLEPVGEVDESWVRMHLAIVCSYLGDVEAAFAHGKRLQERVDAPGTKAEAVAANALSLAHLVAEEWSRALTEARRASRAYRRIGLALTAIYVDNVAGLALLGLSRVGEAEQVLRDAADAASSCLSRRAEGIVRHNLSHALRRGGRLREAASESRASAGMLEGFAHSDAAAAVHHGEAIRALLDNAPQAAALELVDSGDLSRANPDLYPQRLLQREAFALLDRPEPPQ